MHPYVLTSTQKKFAPSRSKLLSYRYVEEDETATCHFTLQCGCRIGLLLAFWNEPVGEDERATDILGFISMPEIFVNSWAKDIANCLLKIGCRIRLRCQRYICG